MRSVLSITRCARTSLLETLVGPSQESWGSSGYVTPGPVLGRNLPPLPPHYLNFEVKDFCVIFRLASRQAQIHPADPSFGRLHVCDTSRPADRQTDGQTGRQIQTEANRQTLTDTCERV